MIDVDPKQLGQLLRDVTSAAPGRNNINAGGNLGLSLVAVAIDNNAKATAKLAEAEHNKADAMRGRTKVEQAKADNVKDLTAAVCAIGLAFTKLVEHAVNEK